MDEEKALPQPPNASNLTANRMLALRTCVVFYIGVLFYWAFFRSTSGLVNIYIHQDLEAVWLPFDSVKGLRVVLTICLIVCYFEIFSVPFCTVYGIGINLVVL